MSSLIFLIIFHLLEKFLQCVTIWISRSQALYFRLMTQVMMKRLPYNKSSFVQPHLTDSLPTVCFILASLKITNSFQLKVVVDSETDSFNFARFTMAMWSLGNNRNWLEVREILAKFQILSKFTFFFFNSCCSPVVKCGKGETQKFQ